MEQSFMFLNGFLKYLELFEVPTCLPGVVQMQSDKLALFVKRSIKWATAENTYFLGCDGEIDLSLVDGRVDLGLVVTDTRKVEVWKS